MHSHERLLVDYLLLFNFFIVLLYTDAGFRSERHRPSARLHRALLVLWWKSFAVRCRPRPGGTLRACRRASQRRWRRPGRTRRLSVDRGRRRSSRYRPRRQAERRRRASQHHRGLGASRRPKSRIKQEWRGFLFRFLDRKQFCHVRNRNRK